MKRLLFAALAVIALATPASAATRVYDVERVHLIVPGDITGRGWFFAEDIKLVSVCPTDTTCRKPTTAESFGRSTLQLVLIDGEGPIIYNCHLFGQRDFNIINVGPNAQQVTGATSASFMLSPGTCGGGGLPGRGRVKVIGVSIACPWHGSPAAELGETFNNAGGYPGATGARSTYKITGLRDTTDFCNLFVTELGSSTPLVYGGDRTATLTRVLSSHKGDTSFVDFIVPPRGFLGLQDIGFPF